MRMKNAITLSEADLKEYVFDQDGVHFSHPLSPLFASYMIPAMTEGTRGAMEFLKAPMRQFICRIHDGYFYQAVVLANGDPNAIEAEHRKVIEPMLGHQREQLAGELDTVLLPRHEEIVQLTEAIQDAGSAKKALLRLQEIYQIFWEAHFRIVLPRAAAGFAFQNTFQTAFPDADPNEAYTLLVGEMNKTLESDRALWALAEQAKQDREVMAALASPNMEQALQVNPHTAWFNEAVSEFLQQYGWRTVYAHEFLNKTWVEDRNYCLTVLKGYIDQGFDFDEHWNTMVRRRNERMQELAASITDPKLHEAFWATWKLALEAWPIDEDHHFYIDAMLPARSRLLVLAASDVLVAAGILADREDIHFLYLDEVLDALDGHPPDHARDLVAERREEHRAQQQRVPAPRLGGQADEEGEANPLSVLVFGANSPALVGATREVRGFPASAGQYVGPVRVVRGPEEFFKVRRGDVLVCRSSAPSWTGLFAVAGAVITETGGILSHAATVAREYGIPCIVGTREATHVFQDGQSVLVDGTEGVATVQD